MGEREDRAKAVSVPDNDPRATFLVVGACSIADPERFLHSAGFAILSGESGEEIVKRCSATAIWVCVGRSPIGLLVPEQTGGVLPWLAHAADEAMLAAEAVGESFSTKVRLPDTKVFADTVLPEVRSSLPSLA